MAYGVLFRRAWQLVWTHKYLIWIAASPLLVFVFAAALNSATAILGSLLMLAAAVLIEGWLVTAIFQVIDTGQSGYRLAWDAAWPKKWLVGGVTLLAGLPGGVIGSFFSTVIVVVWIIAGVVAFNSAGSSLFTAALAIGAGLTVLLYGLMILVSIPFGIWGRGALIACLHEGTDVTESFSRAWQVFRPNLRQVATLALIQMGISLPAALIIGLPLYILSICPVVWPLSGFVLGFVSAWWTTVWALAWQGWAQATTILPSVRNT